MMKLYRIILPVLAAALCGCSSGPEKVTTFPLSQLAVEGPLRQRIDANLNRLQDDIYQPPHVFEDLDWPGDFIGRTILGLTLESQALYKKTELLPMLIDSLPSKFNDKGYLGPDYWPAINEQQLSGHGWLLRALCEYYRWTGDKEVLKSVQSVAKNLFVAGKGMYSSYPISPEQRTNKGGEASGSIAGQCGDWILSTDIGCVFIGMAGLIDAYEFVPDKEIKAVIEELIARFLEVDLVGIQAQTHATLSALRGLIKYSQMTGDESLMDEVLKRWQIYVSEGMTCCYANLNWFGRPDSWTEPCAIVDSYIVAFELWRSTMEPSFRDMAELIEVNALGHAQRSNGGFGCDNCPSEANPFLTISIPEAHWCCTMRGAEGLSRMAEYSWAVKGGTLYVPFYRQGALCAEGLEVTEKTEYPFAGEIAFKFYRNEPGIDALMLPDLPWVDNTQILVNDEPVTPEVVEGMLCVRKAFVHGDEVVVKFDLCPRTDEWDGCKRLFYGSVMLGNRSSEEVGAFDMESSDVVPNMMSFMDHDCIQVLFKY